MSPIMKFIFNNKVEDYFHNNSIFVFHHIHKVGGTSLEELFSNWFFYKRELNLNKKVDIHKLKNFQALGGHYGYHDIHLTVKYPNILENPSFKVFTMVRDPLTRAISHYNHWKKNGFKKLNQYSLEDYLVGNTKEDWTKQMSSDWMAYVLNCNDTNYKIILDKYFLVGIFEELNATKKVLAHFLGKPNLEMPHKRKGEKNSTIISPEIIEIFKHRNTLDYQIYNYSLERFNSIKTTL